MTANVSFYLIAILALRKFGAGFTVLTSVHFLAIS